MSEPDIERIGFAPLRPKGGYLPLADHGFLGDGRCAALVARDGAVSWLCLPRFDSPPLFAGILDRARGGRLLVSAARLVDSRQAYVPDTCVLVTELRTEDGLVRLTDALALRPDADLSAHGSASDQQLVRRAEVIDGHATVRVEVDAHHQHRVTVADGRLGITGAQVPVRIAASVPLDEPKTTVPLRAGDHLDVVVDWSGRADVDAANVADSLRRTQEAWTDWAQAVHYVGPNPEAVRRSAVTLKALDHQPNGAIVAAPTSSLPEQIGGSRNWDYRYTWIRDASFTVYALRRIGLRSEAGGFLRWVLDTAGHEDELRVLYGVDGLAPPPEREDASLEGYRQSAPVRWGNDAANQSQHCVYGEVLDCAFQWADAGGRLDERSWRHIRRLVDRAARLWRVPDHGIWEVRSSSRPFTYSAAMCHVALDRGARLAGQLGHDFDRRRWRVEAERVRSAVLAEAWDPGRRALTQSLEQPAPLDASVLSLPLRRVLFADDERMVSTVDAIVAELGAGDGLVYRYDPEDAPDGLAGDEGAFLTCSFWLVDNLANQSRLGEALELFEALSSRGGPLGLLPEEVDPATGEFLGNYPQALSHVALVSSGVLLARRMAEQGLLDDVRDPMDQAFDTATEGLPPPRRGQRVR